MAEEIDYGTMRFEDLLERLEEVIDKMDSDEIGIEEATDLYEKAERLQVLAHERLDSVRERSRRLAASSDGD